MTATDPITDLFAEFNAPDKGLKWLADELLREATERPATILEGVPGETGKRVLHILGNPPAKFERIPISVFRSFLSVLSGLGSEATGAKLNPYGDRFTLLRESKAGPVRLDIEIGNTPAVQRLQILRTILPVVSEAASLSPEGT